MIERITNKVLLELAEKAWIVRENSSIVGKTKVGAALLSSEGNIYVGCNVEQKYRNHDVHAEVNAITNMIASGDKTFKAIVVVSERDHFTPCGSCLDWIFQFGGENTIVAFQKERNSKIKRYTARELMPYYPF